MKLGPLTSVHWPLTQWEQALARRLPARAWNRLSVGVGAKGHRWYDWALIDIRVTDAESGAGDHALLVRRSISTGELAFCLTGTLRATSGL